MLYIIYTTLCAASWCDYTGVEIRHMRCTMFKFALFVHLNVLMFSLALRTDRPV